MNYNIRDDLRQQQKDGIAKELLNHLLIFSRLIKMIKSKLSKMYMKLVFNTVDALLVWFTKTAE